MPHDETLPHKYDIGDEPELRCEFKDRDGRLTSPSAVVVRIARKDGDTIVPVATYNWPGDAQVSKTAEGVFRVLQVVDRSGEWFYRYEGTGVLIAAGRRYFFVRPDDMFYPGL